MINIWNFAEKIVVMFIVILACILFLCIGAEAHSFGGLFEIKDGVYILIKEVEIHIPYNLENGSTLPAIFPKGTVIQIKGGKDERD